MANPEHALIPILADGIAAAAALGQRVAALDMLGALVRLDPDLGEQLAARHADVVGSVRIHRSDRPGPIRGHRATMLIVDEAGEISNADRLEARFHELVKQHDFKGAIGYLELLAGEDLERAGRLHTSYTEALRTVRHLRGAGVTDDAIKRMIDERLEDSDG